MLSVKPAVHYKRLMEEICLRDDEDLVFRGIILEQPRTRSNSIEG